MPVNEWKELYIDPRTDLGIARFTPKELQEYEEIPMEEIERI